MAPKTGRARACAAWAALLLLGCVASPPDLTEQPWDCDGDGDCIDGWVCADLGVLGHDVCRPACDPASPERGCPDGFCTSAGVCWDTCQIASDGALDRRCHAGLSCVRRNGFTGAGLCMPTAGCTVSTDCLGESYDCANEVFGLPASDPSTMFSADHSFCTATPQGEAQDRCPAGYFPNNGICVPSCDQADDRCPPGMACVKGLGTILGSAGRSACLPGVVGLPCRDDSECFEGTCLELASGTHICTLTCAQAARMSAASGCDILDGYPVSGFGGLDFECDTAGVCAARGAVGAPCNESMPCNDQIACLNDSGGVCTKPCNGNTECLLTGVDPQAQRLGAYCASLRTPTGGSLDFCMNQRPVGATCDSNAQCSSGRCLTGHCVVPLPR